MREAAIFGYFGQTLHITDESHLYMRNAQNPEVVAPLFSWMPFDMRSRWNPARFKECELGPPLPFSKEIPVPRFPGRPSDEFPGSPKLFDLLSDPGQKQEITDPEVEQRLISQLAVLLQEAHAPRELYTRFDLPTA